MDLPIISIIVPVYNVEKYLKQCVDSILAQTFSDIEIILVDDGSPDECPKICDEYQKKDARVRVIHKSNGGLSDARNAGIKAAKGEYIGFVDSDDYIAPDMYEKLYKMMNDTGADMAVCQAVIVTDDSSAQYTDSDEIKLLDKDEALYRMICKRLFTVNSWNKLYKKNLFNNIMFPVNMLYEDLATTYKLIDKCKTVVYSPMKKYAYRQRAGSIMNLTGYMVSTDKIKIVNEMLNYLDNDELKDGILRYLLNDIYKMAACGNLVKNAGYTNGVKELIGRDKMFFKNTNLTFKEKVIFRFVKFSPVLLQRIYKRRNLK